jgi:hypothetical protein
MEEREEEDGWEAFSTLGFGTSAKSGLLLTCLNFAYLN